MNNYGFQFAEAYTGYWNIPNIGRKIPGTLFLEKHAMRLELFWNNTTSSDLRILSSATGYAYTERNNKKWFKNAISKLNDVSTATSKFYLILDELNIKQTKEIKGLIKGVRNTLVHDAVLKDYYDYVLLSELIREIILRLISSIVERHSEHKSQAILGDALNLSYNEYVVKNDLDVEDNVIFSQYDKRIKLWITKGENKME